MLNKVSVAKSGEHKCLILPMYTPQLRQLTDFLNLNKENSQFIIKHLKNLKSKLQVSIQGDQLRVSGKKKDHLQEAISSLNTLDITIPLIFNNFRD